jgi:phage FluMu protein Com
VTNYFRSPEMQNGGPFLCYNCSKKLAVKIKGPCHIQFKCPRCHAFISIKMSEPVAWGQSASQNGLTDAEHQPANQPATS